MGATKIFTFVTTPSIPSEPTNNYFKSMPELSFLILLSKFKIFPSALTTSKP